MLMISFYYFHRNSRLGNRNSNQNSNNENSTFQINAPSDYIKIPHHKFLDEQI